ERSSTATVPPSGQAEIIQRLVGESLIGTSLTPYRRNGRFPGMTRCHRPTDNRRAATYCRIDRNRPEITMTTIATSDFTCPNCGTEFSGKTAVSVGRVVETRTDFQKRTSGVQSLAFLVQACPQ